MSFDNAHGYRRYPATICISAFILVLLAVSMTGPVQALTFASSIDLKAGENNAISSIIDTVHNSIYYGTSNGVVAKVQLTTFTEISSIALTSGVDLKTAVLDFTNQLAYFGSDDSTPAVTKIDLKTFTESAVIKTGFQPLTSAVIDATGRYAYFGSNSVPATVYKVDLTNFVASNVISLTLPAGVGPLTSAVLQGHYAYFGTDTNPGVVVRIDLANFSIGGVATLNLNSGESGLRSAVIDTTSNAAYFGTGSDPGIIVKIDLTTFTHIKSLTLQVGDGALHSATSDSSRSTMYFGSHNGVVVEVNMTSFVETSRASVPSASDLVSAVLDPSNDYGYFGSVGTPATVFKLDLRPNPPPVGGLTVPVDKLMLAVRFLLLPGIAVAGISALTVIMFRRRKSQQHSTAKL